jgi:hypothetical protein
MQRKFRWLAIFVLGSLLVSGCQFLGTGGNEMDSHPLGAGFRYSSYGPPYNPGPDYWVSVGQQMAGKFEGAVPQGIWILSTIHGEGTFANFPTGIESPYILDSPVDGNEAILTLFDEQGVQVWLQVEPGMAPVEDLIHALLKQYGHHPSVIGVGVDVEWYQSSGTPEGKPVSDEEARAWVTAARSHGEQYRVFLKHWEIGWMPPTERDGLVFIDDSQEFDTLDDMIAEFEEWGEAFAPAPVGFQFGYRADKPWWGEFDDPPATIGNAILEAVPNTEALYWVDFTVLEVFPPTK